MTSGIWRLWRNMYARVAPCARRRGNRIRMYLLRRASQLVAQSRRGARRLSRQLSGVKQTRLLLRCAAA